MKRNCIIKKLWEAGTPYIQASGWVILIVSVAVPSIILIGEARAFDGRLTSLETAYNKLLVVDEKLDLVIELLKDRRA